MSWPIRARLTAWYSAVLLAVLATVAIAVVVIQNRASVARLDAELSRLASTVQAVMTNEFGEGLDLDGAAGEASTEVISTGRTIVILRGDRQVARAWGAEANLLRAAFARLDAPLGTTSVTESGTAYRLIGVQAQHGTTPYIIVVAASMQNQTTERAALIGTLAVASVLAVIVGAAGGWIVGGPALRPLTVMAREATQIGERNLHARLSVPNQRDELGQVAMAFNALVTRLASALHTQRQFMADASHQLRTPVSILKTSAEVALRETHRSECEYREALEMTGDQAERLTRLVNAMLLLSRAEAFDRPLVREPLYLDDLVGDCARALSILATERDVHIDVGGAKDVPLVGDEQLLRHLFTNLLDNAIRYSRSGGRILIDVRHQTERVDVRIVDDGPGIAAGDRERVFQRFTRATTDGDGAGLGLPIARWVADAHGGSVTIESSSPSGTVFVVSLPLGPIDEAERT